MDNLERRIRTLCHCIRAGISDPTQKRALLLHLPAPTVPDILNNSTPTESRGGAKDYDKAMECLSDHFKSQKNAPMARQAFLAATRRWVRLSTTSSLTCRN